MEIWMGRRRKWQLATRWIAWFVKIFVYSLMAFGFRPDLILSYVSIEEHTIPPIRLRPIGFPTHRWGISRSTFRWKPRALRKLKSGVSSVPILSQLAW